MVLGSEGLGRKGLEGLVEASAYDRTLSRVQQPHSTKKFWEILP